MTPSREEPRTSPWLKRVVQFGLLCATSVLLVYCSPTEEPPVTEQKCAKNEGYEWHLPKGFPKPCVPPDNPMTADKVKLGRYLFYDKRLSGNQTQSCATCHKQNLAFTDGLALSPGSTGQLTTRNSMSLANIAYSTTLTWANPLLPSLEKQIDTPLFGERPIEMGMRGLHDELVKRVRAVDVYKDLFPKAFPKDSDPFTVLNVKRAIASFERRLISGNSPYDQAVYGGKKDALSDAARRGMKLFSSEKFECFHCHVGFNFQDAVFYEGKEPNRNLFHNTGLYNIGGTGKYPDGNTGVHHITDDPSDMGRFRAPTLRNIEVTAPYMHDGSIKTLSDVLEHYAAGGRTIKSGPHAGVGADNPHKSFFIIGFEMTESERSDMIAFLKSLTDKTFLTDPALSDPWKK